MLGAGLERNRGRAFAHRGRREGHRARQRRRKKAAQVDAGKSARARRARDVRTGSGAGFVFLRSGCSESGHRSGFAAGAKFFIAKNRNRSASSSSAGVRASVPVIAITGTNGKTTTTELLAQMLNACGQRTIACGNIGKPLSRSRSPAGKSFDVLTVEVSSFQLETIRHFPARDQRLVKFCARSSRSLSLGRGISRGQAAHFR